MFFEYCRREGEALRWRFRTRLPFPELDLRMIFPNPAMEKKGTHYDLFLLTFFELCSRGAHTGCNVVQDDE